TGRSGSPDAPPPKKTPRPSSNLNASAAKPARRNTAEFRQKSKVGTGKTYLPFQFQPQTCAAIVFKRHFQTA
ncbi:hypothetical protein, partial [Roseibium sp. RKSG952]|uniref:hypothetical protein n=1 Tax=Roseibium sp. RKSG952 TaxID=2529384 RepID=UPI001AD9326F